VIHNTSLLVFVLLLLPTLGQVVC